MNDVIEKLNKLLNRSYTSIEEHIENLKMYSNCMRCKIHKDYGVNLEEEFPKSCINCDLKLKRYPKRP